jgi:cation diffusion facilitator family transporter
MTSNLRLQAWVVSAGAILLVAKFIAYFLSHSNAILSDALESIVNVVAGAFSLYSIYLSSRPRDKEHPYGHGKIEFISSAFEGGLILTAGIIIIIESVNQMIEPKPLHSLDLGFALIAATGLANGLMGVWLTRRGVRTHSSAMITTGKHLQSDAWTSAGLVLGIGLIWLTDLIWLDSAIALIFALFIMVTGLREMRRSFAGIMDETDFALVRSLIQIMNESRQPDWIDLHNLRVIKYGAVLHIDCHVTLPYFYTIEEGHVVLEAIQQRLLQQSGRSLELFIHADPCLPQSCTICQLDCPKRRQPFVRRIAWNLDTSLPNLKHEAHAE